MSSLVLVSCTQAFLIGKVENLANTMSVDSEATWLNNEFLRLSNIQYNNAKLPQICA